MMRLHFVSAVKGDEQHNQPHTSQQAATPARQHHKNASCLKAAQACSQHLDRQTVQHHEQLDLEQQWMLSDRLWHLTCRHEARVKHPLCEEEALSDKMSTLGARRCRCNVGPPTERGIFFSDVPPCEGARCLNLGKPAGHSPVGAAAS